MKKALVFLFAAVIAHGRVSSYKPGVDGMSGTRLAGARCLKLAPSLWDWSPAYPVPVCAMRAGCKKGQVRLGDLAVVRRKGKDGTTWSHACVVLDTGPWGCIDKKGGWNNCAPSSKYKGKLPAGWRWKSVVDVAAPGKGYPGGGQGGVTVFHVGPWKWRRVIVQQLIDGAPVRMVCQEKKTWKRTFKF